MTLIKKEIEYLVGNKNFILNPIVPYDNLICNFIADLSKELINHPESKNHSDIKTLAFWCRKKNIDLMKLNMNTNELRLGLGFVFHITPSNVPTNFAYSLLFGLLTGNSNLIKLPTKKFLQIEVICECIQKILNLKKYFKLRRMITIVRYSDYDEFTDYISKICNARIIWGGDQTIDSVRKFKIDSRARDITFSDRFSLCVINPKTIIKSSEYQLRRIIENFYNDTYLVDQNACSSPHLLVWIGKKNIKAENIFWNKLHNYISEKYFLPDVASIDKHTKLCEDIVKNNFIKSYKKFDRLLHVVTLNSLDSNMNKLRGKWGYFYEYNSKNLNQFAKFLDTSCQTLTYIGFKKDFFKKFVLQNNIKGVDRIVPSGQGLTMTLKWDGYDLNQALSRIIDLK